MNKKAVLLWLCAVGVACTSDRAGNPAGFADAAIPDDAQDTAGLAAKLPFETPIPLKIEKNFKGHELYSWRYEDRLCYTLIFGTNRNKYLKELLMAQGDQTHIACSIEGLQAVLAKLPRGAEVAWLDGSAVLTFGAETGFAFPNRSDVAGIVEYAKGLGLEFGCTCESPDAG